MLDLQKTDLNFIKPKYDYMKLKTNIAKKVICTGNSALYNSNTIKAITSMN